MAANKKANDVGQFIIDLITSIESDLKKIKTIAKKIGT
jgi:hypothetical protein